MGRPSGVRDGDLRNEGLGGVNGRFCNLLAQPDNLSHFFEEEDISLLIAIDTQTSGVVAAVLLSSKTTAQDFEYFFAILL